MTTAVLNAVELLERSIGYTRGALAGVTVTALDDPTPCSRWTLLDLLTHMHDGLGAFTEAAAGAVDFEPIRWETDPRLQIVDVIRTRACGLLGAWAAEQDSAVSAVEVGDGRLPTDLLLCTAALEITVHGWDVATALAWGSGEKPQRIPEDLAARLLEVAHLVVADEDRGTRFAHPGVSPSHEQSGAPYDVRLLGFLGRETP